MTFIIFFWLVIFFLLFSKNRISLHIIIFICALFMSIRGLETPDTLSYLEWFEYPPLLSPHVEKGYAIFCLFFNDLGFSFRFYLFLLAFIEMEIWVYCTRRLFPHSNINILLAMCLSFYGIYFWGCVLRASMSITIAYLAFTFLLSNRGPLIKKLLLYYMLILLASCFHISALIYLLCPLLTMNIAGKIRWIVLLGGIVLVFLLDQIGLTNYMELVIGNVEEMNRFQHYTDDEDKNSILSFFWIISFVISLTIVINYEKILKKGNPKIRRFMMNLYLIGFLLLTLTINIPAGSRLGMMFTFFEFGVIYYFSTLLKSKRRQMVLYGSYSFLRFAYMIHSFPLFLNY